MKTCIHISLIIILFFFATVSVAQDIHLSQYDANPLSVNPALTGFQLNKNQPLRFNLNYRNQNVNVIGNANKVAAAGLEVALNNKFSIGQMLTNNNINNSFNSFNYVVSGSYNIIQSDREGKKPHHLSMGLQMGFIQKNFSVNNYVFDSQYSPSSNSGFDNNLPSGENFKKQSYTRFDLNMGVFYKFTAKKYAPFGGFSIYHLTQPDQALTSTFSETAMRFTVHGGCNYYATGNLTLLPQFLYMNQGKAQELNMGLMIYNKLGDSSNYEPMIGISWRVKNAIILQAGLKYKSYTFRISYDLNTYYLKQYGNRGVELSVVYIVKKKNPSSAKSTSNYIEPINLETPKPTLNAQ